MADGSYIVGTLLGTERLALPATDVPFAVTDGVVATFTSDTTEGRSVLKLVALGESAPEPVTLPFVGVSGDFAGKDLIVTGGTADSASDPGVIAIDSKSGVARNVVEPGRPPTGWEGTSGTVVAAPLGQSVIVSRCQSDRCHVQILNVQSGAPTGSIDIPGFVRQATDEIVIYGDDSATRISAASIESGKTLWTLDGAEFQYGYLAGSSLVQSRLNDAFFFEIVRIDLASGGEEVLFSAPGDDGFVLWPELSNENLAVVGTEGRLQERGGISSSALISTLDLNTGDFKKDVMTLSFTN